MEGGIDMDNEKLLLQILDNTRKINERLDYIEKEHGKRLQNLENIVRDHSEHLQSIENSLIFIEHDHGEKLQVLFDYFTDQDTKYKETKFDIQKFETKLDNLDSRLFALEYYKNDKLTSK